jgi:hypothetical protein
MNTKEILASDREIGFIVGVWGAHSSQIRIHSCYIESIPDELQLGFLFRLFYRFMV